MLTGDLIRPRVTTRQGEIVIRWVDVASAHWLATAADLIERFAGCAGQPRHVWDAALEGYIGNSLDYVVMRGLAKVLYDAATFTPRETPLPPSDFRRAVFARGPVFSSPDLFFPHTREELLSDATDDPAPETILFADRPAEYILTDPGPEWSPRGLLERYNLELARGALYWAREVRIEIHDNYKDFWRYIKLFKLMFWAEALPGGGYAVTLDGPISPFVNSTTRYGRQFAAFLPALMLCERWRMVANVRYARDWWEYYLDASFDLVSHFSASAAFDSRMEADFAAEFHAKFGDTRGKWTLDRETEVVLLGTTVMIPDFTLTHKDTSQTILIEIMGFWHPRYIERKLAKVRAAKLDNFMLLIYEGVNVTDEQLTDIPAEVLHFKNKPILKDVLARAEMMLGGR